MRSEAIVPLASALDIVPLETLRTLALAASALLVAAALAGAVAAWMSAMRVHLPNGSSHLYLFTLKDASVNGHLARLLAMFQAPRTPVGWKRVVEEMPADPAPQGQQRQAAQPGEAAR